MRERSVNAIRLNAGEYPLPFPATGNRLIGISQSGKSTETLAALNSATRKQRMSVVNAKASPIEEASAFNITLGAIPDSYASTIGYTATVAVLGMIAEAWDDGVIDPSWLQLHRIFRSVEAILKAKNQVLVAQFRGATYVDCVATAPSVGSAEVGALLLREIARIPATGLSTRQYLHGAMESAGQGVHIIFGDEREYKLALSLSEAGHKTVFVSPLEIEKRNHLTHIHIPVLSANQRPVIEALIMQTLAVEVALDRELDPDAFVFFHNDTKTSSLDN